MNLPLIGQAQAHALGVPTASGRIRLTPGDFRVDEQLGFEASGNNGHWLIRVEKTGVNTIDAARRLAAHAGVAPRDIGYSGLKDRHAVCTQWFTVPHRPGIDWGAFDPPGIRILEHATHHRKLKRGTHTANRFRIRVALDAVDAADVERRLRAIRAGGVPNYFGEQRFGRRFEDNATRLLAGRRLSRTQRSMTLSAIRSGVFNRVLDQRVRSDSWNTALPGEYVNLDGTRSGFAACPDDQEIPGRIEAMDLHPTGPLWGRGDSPASGEAAALEQAALADWRSWCELLAAAGLKMERRPTRCPVEELDWSLDTGRSVLDLGFVLRRGRFATAVLREILDYRDVTRHPGDAGAGGRAGGDGSEIDD